MILVPFAELGPSHLDRVTRTGMWFRSSAASQSLNRLCGQALPGVDHLHEEDVPVARVAVAVQPVAHDDGRGIREGRGQPLAEHLVVRAPDGRSLPRLHGFEIAPLGGDEPVDVGHQAVPTFGCPV